MPTRTILLDLRDDEWEILPNEEWETRLNGESVTPEPNLSYPPENAPTTETDAFRPFPSGLVSRYVFAVSLRALVERMEDGRWYASVPLLPGVWADADSEEEVRTAVREVIGEWVRLKIDHRHGDMPPLPGIDLSRV